LAEPAHLAAPERALLVEIVRRSVVAAVRATPYALPAEARRGRLGEPGACFVTLHAAGHLRGCIGTIDARRPLGVDAAANAHAAARDDHRFDAIAPHELREVDVHLALLSTPLPLPVRSREELLAALRPGVDGLVLEQVGRRATFLPAVWAQLTRPEEFVAHLEQKAGLAVSSWSPLRRAYTYRVVAIAAGNGLDRY
jgi:AmmeMemoRadiSam system protein A